MEGVDAAVSAWVAEERNRTLSQELSTGGEDMSAGLAREAQEQELDAWG